MRTILLLTISNIFMTFAWYGHLKYRSEALWKVIAASWGIAFFEYCFQVPANRIGSYEFTVDLNDSPKAIADFNNLPVKVVNGAVVFMRDVAHVHDGFQVQTNSVAVNGTPGALMTIRSTGGVSTLAVISGIRAALPEIRHLLPAGISIQPLFDQSLFVNAALDSVLMGGLMAARLIKAGHPLTVFDANDLAVLDCGDAVTLRVMDRLEQEPCATRLLQVTLDDWLQARAEDVVAEDDAAAVLAASAIRAIQQTGQWNWAAKANDSFAARLKTSDNEHAIATAESMRDAAVQLRSWIEVAPKPAPPELSPKGKLTPIDLAKKANVGNTEWFGEKYHGNGLAEMPKGDQEFCGVTVVIAELARFLFGRRGRRADRSAMFTEEATMPLIQVRVIEGVFTEVQKRQIIRRLTDAMVSIEGENLRPVTWVIVDEVKSGGWAIGGKSLTPADVKALAAGKPTE